MKLYTTCCMMIAMMIAAFQFSACAQKKKTSTAKQATTSTSAKPEKNHITYVEMKRTSCYGKCPTYDLEIYESGLVRYKGRMFVTPLGIYEKQFNADTIRNLMVRFQTARVDTMKSTYEVMVSDAPDLNFTFTINNQKKTVLNAVFGPRILRELATEVDEIIGKPDFSWKRIAATVE